MRGTLTSLGLFAAFASLPSASCLNPAGEPAAAPDSGTGDSGHDWAPYFRACDSGADCAADAWRGFVCRNGRCGCPAYQELCEPLPYTHCTDPQTDANHCGSCLNSCPGSESCVEGVCR